MNDTKPDTLGSYLRRERDRRNISIEQLAYATRIGIKMLRSLEDDRHDELPAQPFVRGYLQAYGKYVGIDTQDLFLRYQHHLATHPETKNASLRSHYIYMKERYQERKQLFLVISLFVALIFCAGAYVMLKSKRDHNKAAAKLIALKDAAPSSETNTTNASVTSPAPAPASAHASAPVAAPVSTPVATTQNQAPAEAPDATPKKFTLILKATADAWFRFQTDSEAIKDLTLHSGKIVTLRANKVIKLFSGNLNALQANLNGQDLKSLIQPGRAMSAVLPESEISHFPLPLFPQSNTENNAPDQDSEDEADSADSSSPGPN